MERFIIGVVLLLSCFGSVMAQDAAKVQAEATTEVKSEVKSEATTEATTEVKSEVKSGCVNVRYVEITMATENLNNMYVKFFDSGLPIDNGTGVRQEGALVPRFALTEDDKKLIMHSKEADAEIISNDGEQCVLRFTIMAIGESQIRQKSWMGMRDRALTGIRNGVVVFKADLVRGAPRVSEAIQKCF
jgi:hypothetical protein